MEGSYSKTCQSLLERPLPTPYHKRDSSPSAGLAEYLEPFQPADRLHRGGNSMTVDNLPLIEDLLDHDLRMADKHKLMFLNLLVIV